jgi:hypothetical protein
MNIIDTSNMTRDQVFALRGYGASETAGIAGLGYRNQTRYKIWHRKTSGVQEEHDEEMQNLFWWGNALEPLIAQRFTLETGLEFAANQVLVQHPTYAWMTALIDGVTTSEEIESLGLHPVQAVMRYHVFDGNFKFRQHVRAQQVANHIVNEWVEAGIVGKLAIETNGKRDNKKVAAVLQETWDSDPGERTKSASDYLASKVIPAEAPEPGFDG